MISICKYVLRFSRRLFRSGGLVGLGSAIETSRKLGPRFVRNSRPRVFLRHARLINDVGRIGTTLRRSETGQIVNTRASSVSQGGCLFTGVTEHTRARRWPLARRNVVDLLHYSFDIFGEYKNGQCARARAHRGTGHTATLTFLNFACARILRDAATRHGERGYFR